MIPNFVDYLNEHKAKKSGRQNLFTAASRPFCDEDISRAEKALSCSLPAGYSTFLKVLGAGSWTGISVSAPGDLYEFDESSGEMRGMVPLSENVDGCGNSVAFNPRDQKLYFCCHDPIGCSHISDSFEDFVELITAHWLKDPQTGTEAYFSSLLQRL